MRIYIIGNDGITLCREAPAILNEGEIAVAAKEELHTALLSGKRLLALWNALPGVEKRKKVGDLEALIDQLWLAIEALPDPEPQTDAKRPSKQDEVIAMLRRPEGATVDEVASVTGWQRHTVRGVFSGTLKKKLGLTIACLTEIAQAHPEAERFEIWSQDEAWVGQKGRTSYVWWQRGHTPRGLRDVGHQSAWITGAVCPTRYTVSLW